MSSDQIPKILNDRASKYGDFRYQARLSISMKDEMHKGASWDGMPAYMKESLDMVQHKIARIVNGDPTYEDSWVDIIGYAQLALDRLRSDHLDTQIKEKFDQYHPDNAADRRGSVEW